MLSFPIRSWKTTTTIHGIVMLLLRDPGTKVLFMSNTHARAQSIAKRIRELAEQAGVGPVSGRNTIEEWENAAGGGVVSMSSEQSRLGYDCHVLICDDPLDELMANRRDTRDMVDEHIAHYTFRSLRDGRKGDVLIVASRWSDDDPIGRRLQRKAETWEYCHTPGILEMGTERERSFCETIWPIALLRQELRIEAETDPQCRRFWAQIMGEPKAPGVEEFGEPARYQELPAWPGFRDGIGIDMSFTVSKKADHFALCVGRWYMGTLFVRELRRLHADLAVMEAEITKARHRYGSHVPIYSYVSGPEKAAIQSLYSRGLPVQMLPARFNKYVRAQATRSSWNTSRVLFPLEPWVGGPVQRIRNFRGFDGDEDDELDALTSLHDAMAGFGAGVPRAFGQPRI